MKLTRRHELLLIDLGLKQILDDVIPKPKKVRRVQKRNTGAHKWTRAQHEKYAVTMEKKWGKKNPK